MAQLTAVKSSSGAMLTAAAAERNLCPILEQLGRHLPALLAAPRAAAFSVLEVASGTGQHAAGFATSLENCTAVQPTDPCVEYVASIDAHAAAIADDAARARLLPAAAVDVLLPPDSWLADAPAGADAAPFDVLFNCNMVHIAPWTTCAGLFRGAQHFLSEGGVVAMYGPFSVQGAMVESNKAFDTSLRERNSEWGVRSLEDVADVAASHGFRHALVQRMPANNLMLFFQKESPRPPPTAAGAAFLASVSLLPHSVLGSHLSASGDFVNAPPELLPDAGTVFVDPAGLPYVQEHGPAGAGGAAGAIYDFLGIGEDASFPPDVVEKVAAPCEAAFHLYESQAVIHVVGPNFNCPGPSGGPFTRTEAVAALSAAYAAVLREFLGSTYARERCTALRLLPISGGIFGGELADTPARMAAMTVDGLTGGHALLTADEQEQLRTHSAALHMCLFVQNEVPAFQAAWEQGQRLT